jgi:hypothetical protein
VQVAHDQALVDARSNSGAGWRLPDVKELASIADITRTAPAIDPAAFPDTVASRYWSSTPYPKNSSEAFAVTFQSGRADTSTRTNVHYVRLVRSP